MVPFLLALATMVSPEISARTALEISDIKAVYGIRGPERPDLCVPAGETVHFRFNVTGMTLGSDEHIDFDMKLKLVNADGKTIFEQTARNGGKVAPQLRKQFAGTALVELGRTLEPGDYHFTLSLEDRLGHRSAAFTRLFHVHAADSSIVNLQFAHDREGKMPTGTAVMLGEDLHFRFKVVGVDRAKGKLWYTMKLMPLDLDGREVLDEPLVTRIGTDKSEEVAAVSSVTFFGNVSMLRAGEFRLRITVIDEVHDKERQVVVPLRVLEP